MNTKISAGDVLNYLNFLGYKNVNAEQLKDFVKDLKKIIKYEERKLQENNASKTSEKTLEPHQTYDIFTTLYARGTHASKAKVVPKKESVISVQIKKNNKCHCKTHPEERPFNVGSENEDKENVPESTQVDENIPVKDNSNGSKVGNKVTKPSNVPRPKSSFIRPHIATSHKSDPVTLYHQYQAEWKRHKVPGEDNRTELRWAIRERMLGSRD